MRSVINGISDFLDKCVTYVCAVLLGIMTVAVLTGVLFRYVLQSPLGWTEEISRYLMIWAAALAISIGVKHNEHIGITVLIDAISNRIVKGILVALIDLVVLGFLFVMVRFSIQMVSEAQYQFAQSFRGSMFLPVLSIPVSMGLAALQLLFKLFLASFGQVETITAQSNIDI